MARKKKKEEKAYHCDMYYYDHVCPYRGIEDATDIRRRQGWEQPHRAFCKNMGINWKDEVCPHCVEHKWMFREPPQRRNGTAHYAALKDMGTHVKPEVENCGLLVDLPWCPVPEEKRKEKHWL